MRKSFLLIIFLAFTFVSAVKSVRAQDTTLKVSKIDSRILRLSNVENWIYSPSGKFLAIQTRSKFLLLPAQNIDKSLDNLSQIRQWDGEIVNFLPSEKLVYSADEKLFALDPISLTSEQLLSQSVVKKEIQERWHHENFVVVSNNLIISGTGDIGMGGYPGNIYRYDLRRKQVVKSIKIPEFTAPMLSPSGKYIFHDYGGSNSNYTNIYDVQQNRNYEAANYFNLRKAFPTFRKTNESPLMWLDRQDRFLAIIETGEHPDDIKPQDEAEQGKTWLVLFDVPTRKIIWKKLFRKDFHLLTCDQLDANRLLVSYYEKGTYEISLKTGTERKHPTLTGKAFSVSPDKKRIAYIQSNQLFVSDTNGANKKLILDFPPEGEPHEYYKDLVLSTPSWSKSGDALIFYKDDHLLIIQL